MSTGTPTSSPATGAIKPARLALVHRLNVRLVLAAMNIMQTYRLASLLIAKLVSTGTITSDHAKLATMLARHAKAHRLLVVSVSQAINISPVPVHLEVPVSLPIAQRVNTGIPTF